MTKPFKLRLNISSFQFCRSNKASTLAESPLPATHTFTPLNTKAFDITYPKSPAPPPSTPIHPFCKRNNILSEILPIGLESVEPSNMDSSFEKLYNSPDNFDEFDQSVYPFASLNTEKNTCKVGSTHWLKDPSATSFTMSISSADSGWFSSEDESECSSLDSSSDFDHPLKTPSNQKATYGNGTKRKKKNGEVKKLKTYVSSNWKDGEKIKLATSAMLPESDSSVKKTVLGGLLPCMVDGKVNDSYAIMKKSADPLDDFKMSMLEMIIEKQITEAEDLEKLLMCFLSLNSKEHHAVIVAAFTEVWDELFSSDSKPPNSSD
ncbi:hypothetical protein ACH5RR_035128 [Cinchona calisaya]|uniref:Transcription repressor n=1 Tax=Cinchona calisaya TaxID=153742 RepID=A0ABD2YCY4_9GENT